MIKQSMANNNILEKKFKILRTSILLGNLRNREDTFSEYEDTARKIENYHKNVYEEILAGKMYTTTTLEEEADRLKDLIAFIENRIEEKNNFVDDYIKITSNYLDGLDEVSLADDLSSYQNRYGNILEYLNNVNEINQLGDKLKELRDSLEEKYENKANNEIINSKLEDELIDEFNKIIMDNEYYSGLNYSDIDSELVKINSSIDEKKGVLDTFNSSYQALVNAGISGSEREEYSGYVADARENYYEDLEKRFVLELYKKVLDKQVDYDKLYEKRLSIEEILVGRDDTRNELNINSRDEISDFVNLCFEQFNIIKAQKFNIDSIGELISEIANCETRLDELEEANKREEIQELLREFSEEAPVVEKVVLPTEEVVRQEVEKTVPKKPGNMVIRVREPMKINVKTATDTAKLVMKKVVIVLEPKKFGRKDKLKEASLELENEKKNKAVVNKDEIVSEIKEQDVDNKEEIDEVVSSKDDEELVKIEKSEEVINELVSDEKKNKEKEEFVKEDEIFTDLNDKKISKVENNDDIFSDNSNEAFSNGDPLGFELDTKQIFDDKDVKETKKLDTVKFTANDTDNMIIPTEIFVEDPPKAKDEDLFKSTDPFLDDNDLELSESWSSDEVRSVMPSLGSIGSVKPNNALDEIKNVVNENDDISLPNMGLVTNGKDSVPIVSENYIS